MKIGIYVNQSSTSGGAFYESLSTALNFNDNNAELFYFSSNKDSKNYLKKEGLEVSFIRLNFFDRFLLFIRRIILLYAASIIPGNVIPVKIIKKFLPKHNKFERAFIDKKIDLIYFTSPETNSIYLENLNFIITIWDLAHFTIPFFPELRRNNVFETREIFYRNIIPKSFAIIVGQKIVKDLLIKLYAQNEKKIFYIPEKASINLIKLESFSNFKFNKNEFLNFPEKYLYHPGQYSSHKNQRILIDAIDQLKRRNFNDFGVVFSGTDRGNLKFLKKLVKIKGLENRIIFLPFLSDEDVYKVFKGSFALAMPTFIGPGTLPTMEAMYLGTPLIMPDYKVNKDLYKECSLFYRNDDAYSLSEKIIELDKSDELRMKLQKKGKERYKEIMNDSDLKEFLTHLNSFKNILKTFKI